MNLMGEKPKRSLSPFSLAIALPNYGEGRSHSADQIGDRNLEAINQLSLGQLEDLGEALLDFGDITDLDGWLESQIKL